MGFALQKSTDGGVTFQQVSVDVTDYTLTPSIANRFMSVKDSNNNTYILCWNDTPFVNGNQYRLIKISSTGAKSIATILTGSEVQYHIYCKFMILSRDERSIFAGLDSNGEFNCEFKTDFTDGETIQSVKSIDGPGAKFAIYQDQYIWVASGSAVKIYDYDTKAELASTDISANISVVVCSTGNVLYFGYGSGGVQFGKAVFNGINTITWSPIQENITYNVKQLLIDKWGDLIILTNSGTASTLLKYSNAGTLIQNLNLSVPEILGVGKGAYGLQVYSSDDGTKCWVQFSNDLGTWRTEETTAQGQVFGAVSKLRDNGVTTYGDDHGGDNNYSVRC